MVQKRNLLVFALISATPLLFLTVVWLFTLGSFNLLTAVHSNACMMFTGITTILGAIMYLIGQQDN